MNLKIICSFSTILLFLVLLQKAENAKTSQSGLEQVSENFRLLARVTNAISLQAAAIQQNLNLEIILSEFLHVRSSNLSAILDVDTNYVLSEMKRMAELSKKNGQIMCSKAAYDEYFMQLAGPLSTLFGQPQTKLKIIKLGSKVDLQKVYKTSAELSTGSFLNNDCLKLDIKTIQNFRLLFGEWIYQTVDFNSTLDVLSEFAGLRDNFEGCLQNLRQLEAMSNPSGLSEYRLVREAEKLAYEFSTRHSVSFNLLSQFSDSITMLKSTLPVWKRDALADTNRDEKLMAKFYSSVEKTGDCARNPEYLTPSYTAGFRNVQELMQVFDDLNSEWFVEKIAKRASRKNLSEELLPYKSASEKVINLESAWRGFLDTSKHSLKDGNIGLALSAAGDPLRSIVNEEFLSSMGKANDGFQNCVKLRNSSFDNFKLKQFGEQQSIVLEIIKDLREANKEIKELKTDLLYEPDDKMNKMDQFQKFFVTLRNNINELNKTRISSDLDLIQMSLTTTQAGTLFLKTIERVEKMVTGMQTLKNLSSSLNANWTQSVTLNEIFKEMNLQAVYECLREEQFEWGNMISLFLFDSRICLLSQENVMSRIIAHLEDLQKVQKEVNNVRSEIRATYQTGKTNASTLNTTTNPVLMLPTPVQLSRQLGLCTRVLNNIEKARQSRSQLKNLSNGRFSEFVISQFKKFNLDEWETADGALNVILNDTDELEKIAKKVQNKSLEEMSEIFDIASSVLGITGSRSDLEDFQEELTRISDDEATRTAVVFKEYLDLNLDLSFSKYKTDLANARVIITSLSNYFDEIFGHKKVTIRTIDQSISPFVFVGIGVGALLLVVVFCSMIYGCTEHGRKTFKTFYLYYFGTIKVFENRWRYSMFLDAIDGKNAILDAVRERNKANLLKALQNGAFVDVYNKFGNTALHVATKNAQPDLVKLLIKHGADRSLLNHKNLLPEQMLISKHRETPNERKDEYEEIRKIYSKYRKKNTRYNVPQQFPVSSFHIWMDERTDDKLTNAFMEKFPAITSDEAMLTTTHVVVKVNPAGVLETDDLSLLVWIFNGAIIVKQKWMADCLSDEKLIVHDSKYLVEKVQYKGTTYNTILAWSQAMAKGQMPYMLGICVVVCMEKCKSLYTITQLVTSQGGLMCDSFPKREDFNVEARPYLHAHLGPLFVIHDGKTNLEPYRNDRVMMYTCFTETEFIQFMLKRDIYKDPRDDPANLCKEGEA